ncbi:MAG: hypothetical protein JJU18_13075 [Oceanicaulis sp.]|nr:hypothetical protein [Oceanicaulis sp.]
MLVSSLIALLALAQAGEPAMNCNIGPGQHELAGQTWFTYACSDQSSVVFLAVEPNPAAPFYFIFTPGEEGYRLIGEGNGQRDATEAAYNVLMEYDEARIRQLVQSLLSDFAP